MIQKINKTEEIRERLKAEGKVRYLDPPEDLKAITELNQRLVELKREYIFKSRRSEMSASKVIFNA